MIWIALAALGVPLWLCAVGILVLVVRNRTLRERGGDIPLRRRRMGKTRWTRGHGMWVHDVFSYRGSPAGWSESLTWVTSAATRGVADATEAKKLHRLGAGAVIAVLTDYDGTTTEFATRVEHGVDLLGPLVAEAAATSGAAPM